MGNKSATDVHFLSEVGIQIRRPMATYNVPKETKLEKLVKVLKKL